MTTGSEENIAFGLESRRECRGIVNIASFYSIYFMSLILYYKKHLSLETSVVDPDPNLVRTGTFGQVGPEPRPDPTFFT
jgi:hypothetical protein